jgi:2-polyprenyl-3-methyl-5-hydroxy-6-metoxy-1,4-benzoquinol methylase
MTGPTSTRRRFRQVSTRWRGVCPSQPVEAAIHETLFERALGFFKRLPLRRGARVLEVGCGAGRNSLTLAQRGFHVMATDLVEEMLHLTRAHTSEQWTAGPVRVACCEAGRLPFESGSFDAVLAIGILERAPSPELALVEILRVLRPGGYAVLCATNRWGLQRLLDPWFSPLLDRVRRQATVRCRTHSSRELDALLAGAGLIKLDSVTAGYGPFTFFKRLLFPGAVGIHIHQALQDTADCDVPLFGRGGHFHVVLARRPARVAELIPRGQAGAAKSR